ncbi:DUF1294 domain-containing protein [Vibrio splendidus]|uniref:DUF1294 domain-containing protein n=1 Tax=Vibrio splendidus TaxID=29497 RepID=UPI00148DB336|nr:DUF1294 domain-containing protein [Vibrio splendidus]NOJ02910.1 DUF1294 domain-containing protein [Vibrio splendidus]
MLFVASYVQILITYIVMSLLTFALYAKDKRAAIKGQWRTKESTLHLFSLLGGWPGALLAQAKLRHKTQKQPFKAILWMSIFGNICGFAWALTAQGQAVLQPILANLLAN